MLKFYVLCLHNSPCYLRLFEKRRWLFPKPPCFRLALAAIMKIGVIPDISSVVSFFFTLSCTASKTMALRRALSEQLRQQAATEGRRVRRPRGSPQLPGYARTAATLRRNRVGKSVRRRTDELLGRSCMFCSMKFEGRYSYGIRTRGIFHSFWEMYGSKSYNLVRNLIMFQHILNQQMRYRLAHSACVQESREHVRATELRELHSTIEVDQTIAFMNSA